MLTILLLSFVAQSNASYQLVSTRMTWQNAENHCISLGGHLASISTAFQENTIIDLCRQAGPNTAYPTGGGASEYAILAYDACWMGLQADPAGWSVGDWNAVKWTDGTPFTPSSYNRWWAGWGSYGNQYGHNIFAGDCGFINTFESTSGSNTNGYGWFMTGCTAFEFPFVCEIDPCDPCTPSPISATTEADCANYYGCQNWEELECSCEPIQVDEHVSIRDKVLAPAKSGPLSIDYVNQKPSISSNEYNLYVLSIMLGIYAIITTVMLWYGHCKKCQNGRSKF